jgi:hypothetical protein
MPAPKKLSKPKEPPPPQPPDIGEAFPDGEDRDRMVELLECCVYYRSQEAEAKAALDDDDKLCVPGLKTEIMGAMAESRVKAFTWNGLKVTCNQSSRPTINRAKLIELGVPVAIIDAATKTSTFSVLSIDTVKERE